MPVAMEKHEPTTTFSYSEEEKKVTHAVNTKSHSKSHKSLDDHDDVFDRINEDDMRITQNLIESHRQAKVDEDTANEKQTNKIKQLNKIKKKKINYSLRQSSFERKKPKLYDASTTIHTWEQNQA